MKVALGADHAGFQLKEALKRVLNDLGVEHEDFGATSALSVDYPDYAHAVAKRVADGAFDRGILVCGSGIGMSIAANKVTGIRAASIVDIESARLAREHNDLNVLTLGARFIPESRAREIVREFLQTPFQGGRHATRVDKIEPRSAP